jgi:hydroxymethylglutaryl-CoA lyase
MSSDLPALPHRIAIREVGPRGGLQNLPPVATRAKLALLDALVTGGATDVEVTSFVSPRAVPALADAERVAAALDRWPGVRWSALVASLTGARRAVAAGIKRLEFVVSASERHNRANVGRSVAESLDTLAAIVDDLVVDAVVEVVVATAWDSPFEGETGASDVVSIAQRAKDLGVEALTLADTIGTVTPRRLGHTLAEVRGSLGLSDIGLHLHNTRGAGLAAAYAAMTLGVTRFDASIGGLGGCPFAPGAAGNIATEELVYLARDLGVQTGYDVAPVLEAARRAESILGMEFRSGILRSGDRLVRTS